MPDINVWIALVPDRHIHHEEAKGWFDRVASNNVGFCRITEIGFLRLLTNRQVMKEDTSTPMEAWQIYDALRLDPRVIFLDEIAGVGAAWRKKSESAIGGPNTWTDMYLAAFATAHEATLVTFDQR
ncbi:MAG: PIN domain-containing protein [Acidobacteriaceae bacterium]|nr:PIN domain-containing protein [Acidobacteriaceae bacterium]